MNHTQHCSLVLSTLLAVVPLLGSRADEELKLKGIEFFENHIRPVLVEHCYECHGEDADSVMGGLRLDSRQGWLQGGDQGQAIIAGDPEASLLIQALRQEELEMPPEGRLPERTIELFEEWVRMGAPDPRDSQSSVATTRSDAPHWAFQPMLDRPLPDIQDVAWPFTAIDQFVLSKLEDAGISPVPGADSSTLLRRIHFDLTGLPPRPSTIRKFQEDKSPEAVARVIDRLLNSPRFGERWGRHWLDIARYGESTGHERNFLYPYAWRYRDYVIESFNKGKPYDQFILEQVAGDLLPADSQKQLDEQCTATGFLAIGPRNLLGSDPQFSMDTADDQINVSMRSILALTVACARCHDHKFDPISTQEYYALAGVFLSTETLYGTIPGTGGGNNRHPSELVPLGEHGEQQHALVYEHQQLIAAANKELAKTKNSVKKLSSLPKKQLESKQPELVEAERQVELAENELQRLKLGLPKAPDYAMGVRDAKEILDTHVRIAGDARRNGDVAPRGVLNCCRQVPMPDMPAESSGRLELARWLIDPAHPLTSRVIVNRIWHHLFGRGLVPTVDNFGRNGRLPSHPELLDWLAKRFQDDGWSIKRMIRLIMLSRTYQLASTHDVANYEIDPANILLWRRSPRRLEAEEIRDAMLAVSGQLELRPPQSGSLVCELGNGCLVRQINADELNAEFNYRSIYLPNARYFESEMLQTFDGAAASLIVGDRTETNVPAQSLFFLNNEFAIEQARQAAQRALESGDMDDSQRIQLLYSLALGRTPTTSEQTRALQYLQASNQNLSPSDNVRGWAGLVQAIFAGAEFRYLY